MLFPLSEVLSIKNVWCEVLSSVQANHLKIVYAGRGRGILVRSDLSGGAVSKRKGAGSN